MKQLKDLANGASIARHAITIIAMLAVGVIGFTRMYDQVQATDETVAANTESIKAIVSGMNKSEVRQRVIIQQIKGEKENNKEFRNRTDSSLQRILERLPTRRDPRQ